MTSNRRPLPPPHAATVVAGTPKLAASSSGPSTSPMGPVKEATSSEAKDAAPPARGGAPTAPGAGAFQPATGSVAAKARRAGLWGTVVGVGPSLLKSIGGNKQNARAEKSAPANGKPESQDEWNTRLLERAHHSDIGPVGSLPNSYSHRFWCNTRCACTKASRATMNCMFV